MSDSSAAAEPFQVHYQNTREDWKALHRSLPPGKRFMQHWGTILALAGFVAVCCLPATVVLLAFGQSMAVLAGWGLAAALLIFLIFSAVKSWKAPDESIMRPATLVLHPEFLEVFGDRGWDRRDWSLISRLQPTEELFIIHRDDGLVYAVPRRAFASPAQEQRFVEIAERFHEQAKNAGDLDRPARWQEFPAAIFSADTLQVTYSTDAPELNDFGLILQPVDESPQPKPKSGSSHWWLVLFAILVVAVMLLSRGDEQFIGMEMVGFLAFPVMSLLMIFPTLGLLRAAMRHRQKQPRAVRQTLTISPSGISLWSPRLEMRSTWEAIDAVQQNEKVIIFTANRPAPVHVYSVPKPAFADEYEARHFAETAARYRRAAREVVEESQLSVTPPRVVSDNPYQPPQTQ